MKAKILVNAVLPTVMVFAAPLIYAADEPAKGATVVSGEITPKLTYFKYFKGSGNDRTQFLERYDYQKGGGSNIRSGPYPDVDLNIMVSDPKRDVFVLERQGFGTYNNRTAVKADSDQLGFSGYYSTFRSATGGIDFLYNPNLIVGGTTPAYNVPPNALSGQVAQFNNDSARTLFTMDRTTFGVGLALKPEVLGIVAGSLNYDGYKRDGNRYASHMLLTPGETSGGVLQAWRGFDLPVSERMNRYSMNLFGTPGSDLQLAYDGSLEKFDHGAGNNLTVANFAAPPLPGGSSNPLHFAPDSTLISNNLRLTKNFGSTAVAAGYGLSLLEQDSFTQNQMAAGYNTGKITTNSAYVNVNSAALSGVGLEGFVKYNNRDNSSTFPAAGLIDPNAALRLGVRINKIETFNYGLSGTFRPAKLKSTVTLGWKHEDRDRDLTWSAANVLTAIEPQRSLYRQQTASDELYLNWVARPRPGLIVRVTPSYLRANQTGLVSEPEESLNLKSKVNYTTKNGMALGAFFNSRNTKNTNHTLTEVLATGIDGASTAQRVNNSLHTAGATLGFTPRENLTTNIGLTWMQNDFGTYFISSNLPRYQAPGAQLAFAKRGMETYKVDTYVFSLGADLQATEKLRYSGSYSFSRSNGSNGDGVMLVALPPEDRMVNNDIHSVSLGVDYEFRKNMKLRGMYSYAQYTDKVYSAMSGGVNALMLGLTIGF